jgi:hypothetical protein
MSWQAEVTERARELGAVSVRAFVENHPEATYAELADLLGPQVMPIQVYELHLREAHAVGPAAFREAAADSLVRELRAHLEGGRWSDDDEDNIPAWATWVSSLARVEADREVTTRLWAALKAHAKPGWRPSSKDDPVIVAAFDEAWPLP